MNPLKNITQRLLAFFRNAIATTDLRLLVFLVLFMNVNMALKLGALFLLYLSRPNFKFGLRAGRMPLFYPAMIVLCLLQFIVNQAWSSPSQMLVYALGMGYWAVCFLVFHQVKLSIDADAKKAANALTYFFILNCIVSVIHLLMTMTDSGSINPYTYEGMDLKYHTSTGDFIKGILFDTSNANMLINCFGLFYFLRRQRYLLSVCCLIVALLATSNLGNVILLFFLLYTLFADKTRLHKLLMLCYVGIMVLFMVKVAPSNSTYFYNKLSNLFEPDKPPVVADTMPAAVVASPIANLPVLKDEDYLNAYINQLEKQQTPPEPTTEAQRQLEQIQNPVAAKTDTVYSGGLQTKHNNLIEFVQKAYGDTLLYPAKSKLPGKVIAMKQTLRYCASGPAHLMLGAGTGNFSSKLAFKACGLGVYGRFPQRFVYRSAAFTEDHLRLFCYYFLMPTSEHSVINTPNSVFNQLLGEYGLIGIALFLLLYVWFFARHYRWLDAGKIILPLFLAFLFTEYWFEQFSVVVIFEALLLLDIRNMNRNPDNA